MPVGLGRAFSEWASESPGRPAITFEGLTTTRRELDSRANRLARAYRELGVGPGDFVTIALPNSVSFYEAALATWKLGATVQPVSARLPQAERDAILALYDSALLVGASSEDSSARATVPVGFEPNNMLSDDPIEIDEISPAWTAMTSGGSTGRPKMIVSGRSGDSALLLAGAERAGASSDLTQLVVGPLYHNNPFITSMRGLLVGQHVVVLPRFDAVTALDAITSYRVGWVSLVPTMMHRMLKVMREHPGRYDVSSLRRVWHMAAPCPQWLKEAWIELVGPDTLWELYGATEGHTATTISGRDWLLHRGSVGRAPTGQIKVVDEAGADVAAGTVGEIYMRRPTGTPPTYRYIGAEPRKLGDWESVGDMGWLDHDGYLYLADRSIDMIITGGANVYPAEVEAALLEHPAVEGAIVVGIPDEDLGQRVHAIIQVKGELSTSDVTVFLEQRLVRYKVPRSIRFTVEDLRDDAGKARRSAIRDHEITLMTRS